MQIVSGMKWTSHAFAKTKQSDILLLQIRHIGVLKGGLSWLSLKARSDVVPEKPEHGGPTL